MQGIISDMLEERVVQPLLVTSSAITLATECVRMILKVRACVGGWGVWGGAARAARRGAARKHVMLVWGPAGMPGSLTGPACRVMLWLLVPGLQPPFSGTSRRLPCACAALQIDDIVPTR